MVLKRGFTIIEMVIYMGIFALMLGSLSMYLGNRDAEKSLSTTKERIVDELLMARNLARTNQTKGSSGEVLYVEVVLNGSGALIVSNNLGEQYKNEDITPDNVTVSTPVSVGDLRFEGGSGILATSPLSISIVSNDDVSRISTININSAGVIE